MEMSVMIEESYLRSLAAERQAKIRAQIDERMHKGYPAEFLDVDPLSGTVLYDMSAHSNAIELAHDERILPLLRRPQGATMRELKRVLGFDVKTIRGMLAVLREDAGEEGEEVCTVRRTSPVD